MKFKIVGDYVTYGGVAPFSPSVKDTNLCISKAIDILRENGISGEIDIDTIYKTKEDSMGCYSRFQIQRDSSVETIWSNLSAQDKKDIFRFAEAYMLNETAIVPELAKKIEGFDDEI